jgi:hypothetical protein
MWNVRLFLCRFSRNSRILNCIVCGFLAYVSRSCNVGSVGTIRRSQWPSGLRRGSAAARLLELRFRIPAEACMSVSCECCVLSGRGLCVGLTTRLEESYRVWCLSECDREAWKTRRPWSTRARLGIQIEEYKFIYSIKYRPGCN